MTGTIPISRTVFAQVPDAVRKACSKLETEVYIFLMRQTEEDRPYLGTNAQIAQKTGINPSSINRILLRLKTVIPPGLEHPIIAITGGTRQREIRVIVRPLLPAAADIRSKGARDADTNARAGTSNANRKSRRNKADAPRPLCNVLEFPENKNVNVPTLPENARMDAGQFAVPKPVESVPAIADVQQPALPADGVDVALAGLSLEQLQERVAELGRRKEVLKSRPPGMGLDAWMKARCEALGAWLTAKELLEARESASGPPLTPRVESIGPKPAAAPAATPAAPARPSMQSLIGRLSRTAGPGPIEEFARAIADAFDDRKSLGLYRQIGREIQQGRISPRRAWEEYQKARSGQLKGTARCPGAIFTAGIQQLE